jgi:hypothetical protein
MALSFMVIMTIGMVSLDIAGADMPSDAVYNKEMIDWWDELVGSVGQESRVVWTDVDWGDDLWVEIEDVGEGTYLISLFGLAESGEAIEYTITETENGYHKNGPALADGSMDSRTYIREAGVAMMAAEEPMERLPELSIYAIVLAAAGGALFVVLRHRSQNSGRGRRETYRAPPDVQGNSPDNK